MTIDLEAADHLFKCRGWLSDCPATLRRRLLACGGLRRFKTDDTLYRFGDMSDGIYGIIEGRITVSIPTDSGTIYDCYAGGPGFWIGDLASFSKANRLVTLTADTNVDCWFLPQARINELIRTNPEFISLFYALTHRNMAVLMRLMAILTIPDKSRRLAAWLLFSNDNLPTAGGWINASQEEIGMKNVMSLPTVRRLLRRLEDKDLIELGYGKVRVTDWNGLLAFSRS
ncbi:Crp/Fnr family transcriptional regulator [Sedimentitalea sp. XS_ASV28]|uniref:Crp/Fnr family transcriptional regulator n=1 Tax=Sedimentitalea sp. XS_ASV28 TaxID=3241296 RepID=UPI003511728E